MLWTIVIKLNVKVRGRGGGGRETQELLKKQQQENTFENRKLLLKLPELRFAF